MRCGTAYGRHLVVRALVPAGAGLATVNFWNLGVWPMVGFAVLLLCLSLSFLWTSYSVAQGVLHIRHGLFHRRVPLRSVTAVHRRALPGGMWFGLGTDFIGIQHGPNAVNVSPRDTDGFVEALRAGMADAGASVSESEPVEEGSDLLG